MTNAWLMGASVVQGSPSVHPNPSAVADVVYGKGWEISNDAPINAFSSQYMQVAPVGFNVPNPTFINEYGTPKQQQITKTPKTVKTNNAYRGGDCR